MSFEIGRQCSLDCALSLDSGRPLSVYRQPSYVGAEHPGIFTFDDNRKMRCHHCTPASLKIRLPSFPASWPRGDFIGAEAGAAGEGQGMRLYVAVGCSLFGRFRLLAEVRGASLHSPDALRCREQPARTTQCAHGGE